MATPTLSIGEVSSFPENLNGISIDFLFLLHPSNKINHLQIFPFKNG
jgi:hypothetical protein